MGELPGLLIWFGMLLFLGAPWAWAQREPQYTQYMYNIGSFNPAYVNTVPYPEIAALYRAQWLDLEGAPRTFRVGTNLPLNNKAHGLGLNVQNDQLGPSAQTYVDLAYAYQVNLSEDTKLSFGMDVGAAFLNVDFSKGTFENPGEPILDGGTISSVYPTIGAGLFLYDSDIWYLGLSVPNFLSDELYDDEVAMIVEDKLQLNAIGGYVFDLSDTVKFKPAFLLNYISGAPLITNLSANFLFNDRFAVGASYRISNAFSGLAGFQISKTVFLGYSYDHSTTPLGKYNQGSHEVILKFYLGRQGDNEDEIETKDGKKKPKQIDTPRFF